MRKLMAQAGSTAFVLLAAAAPVLANAPAGDGPPDYSGITGMYYVLIGIVLAYGVYDTFLRKN
ncbi:exported protein of unknown function [Nitrospira japonica]|uniref:Uncharacterized protein n=1 Tax=Nitrospira japonica TaxID=1325564 RepID=A0A1W1I3J5_9BACT|nr:hypothetical protein [Nitrospira japonica]SLM47564.1 exported protein of unknown function [Nitrospira japonica]